MILSREWQLKNTPVEDVLLPFPLLINRLLASRGFSSEEMVRDFISSSLRHMKSPYALKDMELAVKRLRQAFENDESVLVYGDFDLDGSSGLAILVDGLKDLGFSNISYFQPKRLSDGYGLHAKFIETFKKQGVNLIVTVDLGITAMEAALECKQQGIDLIITDNHLPKETLPDAYAVINPNRSDCDSGLGYFCGAGVGYYLLLALKMKWAELGTPHSWDPKSSLDLLVVAILTDMVPLKNENRALAKHGIAHFQNTKRPALQYLLKSLNMIGRPLSGQDIAIGFAPKLNALSRLEQDVLPIDLFLEKDISKAAKLTHQAIQMNDSRKDLQSEAEEEARSLHSINQDQGFVFVYSENFHKGVIGLVATKLSQEYQVPSFVATLAGDKLVGSARAPNSYGGSLLDIFEKVSMHLDSFGGHKAAAGFQLKLENTEAFRNALTKVLKDPINTTQKVEYDIEASLSELNEDALDALDLIGPYGTGFPVPLFFVKNLQVTSKTVMRGEHIRLQVQDKSSNRKTVLLFSPPPHAKEIGEGQEIDLLVELQWNYYNGRKSTQLLAKDIRLRI
ncbi:MAG: single-stranded-DNA-specific exonuclease RecJ [Bdellovibrionales bacterium]|nr:single-stranded-DNA-specific exonuclease RecJ [Bdellovibrionales bacterium]